MTHDQIVRHRGLAWLFVAVLFILVLTSIIFLSRSQAAAGTTAEEVIKFNHQKHVAAGVQCVFCHPGTLNGPVATLPSLVKCVGCHQNVQVTSDEGQASVDVLMQHWDEGVPLHWEKTYDQPDFVYFAHRPHIAAGVNCENCHGDVGQMAVVRPAYRINMGFCLHCHREQPSGKQSQLTSCSTCHQ
jgi:hypothetical protein